MNTDDQTTRRVLAGQLEEAEFEVYEELMRDACEVKSAELYDHSIAERDQHVQDATARLEAAAPPEARRPPISPGLIRQRMANTHRGRR